MKNKLQRAQDMTNTTESTAWNKKYRNQQMEQNETKTDMTIIGKKMKV